MAVTQLQLVIRLSINCVAALDAGDRAEFSRLMRLRDAEYINLDPFDAMIFRRWPEMSKEHLEAVLACDEAS